MKKRLTTGILIAMLTIITFTPEANARSRRRASRRCCPPPVCCPSPACCQSQTATNAMAAAQPSQLPNASAGLRPASSTDCICALYSLYFMFGPNTWFGEDCANGQATCMLGIYTPTTFPCPTDGSGNFVCNTDSCEPVTGGPSPHALTSSEPPIGRYLIKRRAGQPPVQLTQKHEWNSPLRVRPPHNPADPNSQPATNPNVSYSVSDLSPNSGFLVEFTSKDGTKTVFARLFDVSLKETKNGAAATERGPFRLGAETTEPPATLPDGFSVTKLANNTVTYVDPFVARVQYTHDGATHVYQVVTNTKLQ